jgi:cytoplasmic FMR1 interacting protein
MEPEIQKLKALMAFKDEQVKWFCDTIKSLVKASTLSESLIWQLSRVLDMYKLLDDLKNMKACLNNDFSFYKRYRSCIPHTTFLNV